MSHDMLDAPRIIQAVPQIVASIRLRVPWGEMSQVMGPGIAELTAVVAAQGIVATGPWINHHFRRPTDAFDFEICLPAATVAQTVYHGPYDGLAAVWGELHAWIAANGHTAGLDFWETYAVGPVSNPGPSAWRTELNGPLVMA